MTLPSLLLLLFSISLSLFLSALPIPIEGSGLLYYDNLQRELQGFSPLSPFTYSPSSSVPYSVSWNSRSLLLNGSSSLFISGAIHYPRSTPNMWSDMAMSAKENGINMIESYLFWNLHETERGQFDYLSERKNISLFIETVAQQGLFLFIRLGPYVCAEWNFGGYPMWVRNEDSQIVMRTMDNLWVKEMESIMISYMDILAPYLSSNGGPIILLQVENEFGNMELFYPDHQKYVQWASSFALSLTSHFALPPVWIMCQQDDAPSTVISTCNGFYCDNWISEVHHVVQPNQPSMWTENWVGWFQLWSEPIPHRPNNDVAFSISRWFARGGNLMNYYMYQGGTNLERTAGPLITTSYDYDAPLNEYGQKTEKYYYLQGLHETLGKYSEVISQNDFLYKSIQNTVETHTYQGNQITEPFVIFLSNWGATNVSNVEVNGHVYNIAAWSVKIIDGQSGQVEYDTAEGNVGKGKTQTKSHGNKHHQQHHVHYDKHSSSSSPSSSSSSSPSSIQYFKEPIGLWYPTAVQSVPMEQYILTNDESDYLTSLLDLNTLIPPPSLSFPMKLLISNASDFVSVFLNGQMITQMFSTPFRLLGQNISIAIPSQSSSPSSSSSPHLWLSIVTQTMGLTNYGPYLEREQRGLLGPIILSYQSKSDRDHDANDMFLPLSPSSFSSDLSLVEWTQQPGLFGEQMEIYTEEGAHQIQWETVGSNNYNISFTWYQMNITTPSSSISSNSSSLPRYHLSLPGYSKGYAWVNGRSIGRYWNVMATSEGFDCSPCSQNYFVGPYDSSNCRTQCGQNSQSDYHIPVDWINQEGGEGNTNVVTILEELGAADPTKIFIEIHISSL